MKSYTAQQIATMYQISDETVRKYAIEFADYLSPTANPGDARMRFFTEDDIRVLSYVVDRKKVGAVFADIHIELRNGQRGDPPALEPEEINALTLDTDRRRLELQVELLTGELQVSRRELERLKEIEKQALKNEAKLELLQQQLGKTEEKYEHERRELQVRINELEREIGRLEGKETTKD